MENEKPFDRESVELAACLRSAREAQKLTDEQFASKYEVPVETYRKWERGQELPIWENSISFLRMLGNANRERLHIHMGAILDEIRGTKDDDRTRAFDALAIIMERAKPEDRVQWVRAIEDAAAAYCGLKKVSASVKGNQRRRRSGGESK